MDKEWGDQLDHEGVVVVHCKLVVLPCKMFDGVDRVVDRGVGGLLKILWEVLIWGVVVVGLLRGVRLNPRFPPWLVYTS